MIAYRYDDKGFFVEAEECFLDPLETEKQGKEVWMLGANSTFTAPNADRDGFVQKWNGSAWEYVEDHIGKTGYVDGKFTEIKDYGPLPEGWSDTPLPPTKEELAEQVRAERNGELLATDKYLIADFPIAPDKLEAVKAYRKELREVPKQKGFPHDVTWPVNPME